MQAFINLWWDKAIKPRDLAPKTKTDYRNTLEWYVLPQWGTYRLEEFDAPLIIDMFAELREEYSAATAHRALTKLNMVFDAARRWKYMRDNPVADARKDLPPLQREEKKVLSLEEIRELLMVVKDHRLADMYYLMLILGTRLGETLGLQWGDIDWTANTITIQRQVQEVGGKVMLREATKTEAGLRTLPLPPGLRARLYARHERQGTSTFLFTNDEGGMLAPGSFSRHFRGGRTGAKKKDGTDKIITGVRQKAKLPVSVTPHSFRHTVATRLKELGVSEEIRADILGHGKKTVTQDYSHVTLTPMREALERLEKVLLRD